MYRNPAASGGKTITMLFAVAGTVALALASEAPKPPPPAEPQVVEQRRAPVAEPVRPDEPLVLVTGAPACGNVMSKAAVSTSCRPRGK